MATVLGAGRFPVLWFPSPFVSFRLCQGCGLSLRSRTLGSLRRQHGTAERAPVPESEELGPRSSPERQGRRGSKRPGLGPAALKAQLCLQPAAALSKSAASGWASASPLYGVGLLNRVQGTRMFHAYSTKDSVNHQLTL